MFGQKREATMAKKEMTLEKADIKAFLGSGSRFEGKLMFDEAVRIDGSFTGEIHSKDILVVGETAEIKAEIEVGMLILSGRFSGNVVATQKVELRSPANIEGRIQTPALTVEEGVVFNGTLAMGKESNSAALSTPPVAE